MTCKRDVAAALGALLLALTGCSGNAPDSGGAAGGPDSQAHLRLLADANAAMREGRLNDAARLLDDAGRKGPESPELWLAIARLRLRGGEHLAAVAAADRALALGPAYAPALLLRAIMVRDAHGAADALVWFAAARKADGDNPDILAEYAATLGDSGQATAMLAMVRELARTAPNDPRVPYLQAVLAARGGEFALARSLLTASAMAEQGVPAAMMLDAIISLEQGNADSAAFTLERLAARQPANSRVRDLLAKAMLAGGRAAELVERFGAQAALPEASPYLAMLVARAYERLGDRAAAAPLLARAYGAVSLAPAPLAVQDGLPGPTASLRRALSEGKAGTARQQAAALRERFPASADVASLSGDALLAVGDTQAALADYARAATARRPWALTRKTVWAFSRSGNGQAADLLLARHVAGETETASALIALAAQRSAAADWARVAILLDHAVARGAGHDPALLGLRLRAAQALDQPAEMERFAALLSQVRPRSLAAH